MHPTEKVAIRIEHWIEHNEDHVREYKDFARKLETDGEIECARCILEAAELTNRSSETLRRALEALR
jgi:hypothetical protein